MRSIAVGLAAILALTLPWNAAAQAWPAKTVKIVVPFAAGGPADIYARAVREKLQVALGSTGSARSSVLPEVPTVSEADVAGYEAVIWLGMLAPAGTPKADR